VQDFSYLIVEQFATPPMKVLLQMMVQGDVTVYGGVGQQKHLLEVELVNRDLPFN